MAGTPFKMKGWSPFTKKSPAKKTYKEAYAGLSTERKAKQSEADFIKEAKAWNVKKYGTTEPTKKAAEVKVSKESLAEGKKKVDATPSEKRQLKPTKNVTVSGKPKVETLSKAKLDTKPSTRKGKKSARKARKAEKKVEKAMTAFSEGKTKKGTRKLRKAEKKEEKAKE